MGDVGDYWNKVGELLCYKTARTAGELPHISCGLSEESGNEEWLTNRHYGDELSPSIFKLYKGNPKGTNTYSDSQLSIAGYVGVYRIIPFGEKA